ncbi:OsmC family protein [Salegentibacter flavus]|uniref:Peroxiredoxin, SACOL1771 subfamily n=1 Tax=Salegentibacter flavus TaxID=287099 RepID=A0A1I5BRV0_9FLAO|nr:OsmC family protein [Salegentibacter flavus]SFN77485.1 peroxiredoxin, SACOL1771 subfamily [Salegentibacter flavus]
MEPQAHYYNLDLEWTETRKGKISSPQLNDEIEVATPPEFPGGIEGIWSPEHLFTASVVSCFMTSFTAVAEYSKLDFKSLKCPAVGKMERIDKKFIMSEVVIKPELVIKNTKDEEKAMKLLHKAEEICLITRSIKTEVKMEAIVKITETV